MNQISLRIALAMIPVLALMLTLFGVATAVREGEVIEAEMQRDADDVAASVAQLLGRQQASVEQAQAEVERIDASLAHLSMEVVAGPTEPAAIDAPLVVGTAAILGADGSPVAWVVVTEPLDERDAYVWRALLTDALGVIVATAVAAAFAAAVGRSLVQRRVVRIIGRLEEVGLGEYPDEPLVLGDDELGQLGDAVHNMTGKLREAEDTAQDEVQARRRAELHLRRADRLAAVGRTVAVFAHEVGTPLGVMLGRAERLERGADPERVAHNARIIREQGDRINVFVRRLLDYVRSDPGLALAAITLEPSLRRSVELATDRARPKSVDIALSVDSEAATVDGDAHALTQVFTNLLLNAIDASPDGATVHVSCELARGCEAGAERGLAPNHVHVVIEDEGPGIADDVRDRVFDPFFTTKTSEGGTGLGLAIVGEIVIDHGGHVTLEQAESGGCRAVVHLPLSGGANA